nr:MBL fold metallo-hydrolase [Clostridia bacterium]
IDGVSMEFQLTPGTEAPAEMNTWFPEKKALWMAENCTSTLHNIYTLRGAQVRYGAAWAKYLCDAMTRYGAEIEVVFQSHNWPHWGNKVVNEYLVNTAAAYKYINDQTLTYINQGYTSDEISNMIELPKELAKNWYTRQYYGTVAHNSKAVYQKYMGWYDANPVNLNPLTPSESAKKWVEYMNFGSLDDVLRQAKLDFDAGQYQWVAEVTNTIVFADPNHQAARLLCADALEQLGYQAESGTWRNAYLSGAKELRTGNASGSTKQAKAGSDMQMNMTASNIFDYMGILLDKQAMSPYDFTVNITLADTKQQFMLRFKNGVLLQFENAKDQNAALSITTARQALFYILLGKPGEFAKVAKIEGKQELLKLIMVNLNQFNPAQTKGFNIVEP